MSELALVIAIANLGMLTYLIRRPAPVGTFRTLHLEEDDLLIIQSEQRITEDMAKQLKKQWADVTGTSTNVVVMPPDLDLSIIRHGLRQAEPA